MQTKELLIVTGSIILLSNVSIIGTLYATGQFDSAEEIAAQEAAATLALAEEQAAEAQALEEARLAEEAAANAPELGPDGLPLPPKKTVIHSMAKASYLCEEKLKQTNANKEVSHQFDAVASRYTEEMMQYSIYFETQTTSRTDAPQTDNTVTCEVSAETMEIVGYMVLPL